MKKKDIGSFIILNAFLGYLWVLFIDHISEIANSFEISFVVSVIIIGIGTLLFLEVVRRITPNDYKVTQPVKIAGFISFVLVIAINTVFF